MKNADLYSFGPDGTLWTRYAGGSRRPSSVEEMEGYCRERLAAVPYHSYKTYLPQPERISLPAA